MIMLMRENAELIEYQTFLSKYKVKESNNPGHSRPFKKQH